MFSSRSAVTFGNVIYADIYGITDKLIYLNPLLQDSWRNLQKLETLAGGKITDVKKTDFKLLTTFHMVLYGSKNSEYVIACKVLCHQLFKLHFFGLTNTQLKAGYSHIFPHKNINILLVC